MRLLVHVEGQTEERFVNDVLRDHLLQFGYHNVSARLLGNARQRDHRGGARPWSSVRKEIITHLKQDSACLATTMVDYYGLPQEGEKAWPGRKSAMQVCLADKPTRVEQALAADIAAEMGSRDARRFLPFVLMHEFEALLFSDCDAFSQGIEHPTLAAQFQTIRDAFETPEDINDSPDTAPSKRILQLVPAYQKIVHGTKAVLAIGLPTIRRQCPHFAAWLSSLELQPPVFTPTATPPHPDPQP